MGHATHAEALEAPLTALDVPASQATQEDADASPVAALHVPALQSEAGAEPPVQYAPAGHSTPLGVLDPSAHAKPASAVHGVHCELFELLA